MNLSEAKVLISGAGSGIGQYLMEVLSIKAAAVFALEKDPAKLDSIQASGKIKKIQADVTNQNQVSDVFDGIFRDDFANVLINNAGVIHNELLVNRAKPGDMRHSYANWVDVLNVNLTSVFMMSATFANYLIVKKKAGLIINISSIAANGNIGQSAYAASKAGVEALTKTWSRELSMYKIRCACIAPGFFDTPSTAASLNENMRDKWKKQVPLGRFGQLNELAMGVEFLIENEYFNGKILPLDGGLNL